MAYLTKQTKPLDSEVEESWNRNIAVPLERDIHGVEVSKSRHHFKWRWRITVSAMEFVRDVPLEAELRHEITAALRRVPDVAEAAEEDREVWIVRGEPAGAALVDAVAAVIDARAEAIAAIIRGD
ncbi:MAG: hypothetical protein ABI678_26995 [Kofleriaceae bacterium]